MQRQRIHASINIVGLTIGIVSAILITTFVRYELNFDSDIPGISEVYRVVQRQPVSELRSVRSHPGTAHQNA